MGSLADHINLLRTLAAYERAQEAADLCDPEVPGQIAKAERFYTDLTRLSLACGFEPGRQHRHLTSLEYARLKTAAIRATFPRHVAEAERLARNPNPRTAHDH